MAPPMRSRGRRGSPERSRRGLFIALEGGEGAGKSTQAHALRERLEAAGHAVTLSSEPGGTRLGEEVWRLIARGDLPPLTELLLFAVARAQHVAEVIRPALGGGEVVISDRYADSTLAYQGYGRGLPQRQVRAANRLASQGLLPDLTILLDVPVEVGLARKGSSGAADSIGAEGAAFHRRVRQGYLALAQEEPARFLVVDGTLPPEEVGQRIWARVQALLAAR